MNGQPTAFTKLRSTYRHEADSAIGFQAFNDPAAMGSAAAFQASAANVGYAFNWFYVNSTEAAYFNSGANPVRSGDRRPEPADEGRAGVRVGRLEPGHQRRHLRPGLGPPAVGQPGLLRQLEQQAGAGLRRGRRQLQLRLGTPGSAARRPGASAAIAQRKLGRADVVKIMAEAAVTDLRGQQVLGDLLRVLDSAPVTDPALAARSPSCGPGSRPAPGGWRPPPARKVYQHADAIRIFDAWWPLLACGASSGPASAPTSTPRWSTPSRSTSRRRAGRTAGATAPRAGRAGPGAQGLGVPVRLVGLRRQGPAHACSATRWPAAWAARTAATATSARAGRRCSARSARPPRCRPPRLPGRQVLLGRRPVVRRLDRPVRARRHHPPADRLAEPAHLPAGRVVPGAPGRRRHQPGAGSTGHRVEHPVPDQLHPGQGGRRQPRHPLGQQLQRQPVAPGRPRRPPQVSRVVLRWEAAYATAYRIEVSGDGSSWTPVWLTANGAGGRDDDSFTPVTARYVRMLGQTRGTQYGYSLYEFSVFAQYPVRMSAAVVPGSGRAPLAFGGGRWSVGGGSAAVDSGRGCAGPDTGERAGWTHARAVGASSPASSPGAVGRGLIHASGSSRVIRASIVCACGA